MVIPYLIGYVLLVVLIVWAGSCLRKLGVIGNHPEEDGDDFEEVASAETETEYRKIYGQMMGLKTQYPGDIADTIARLNAASASAALHQYDGL